MVDLTDRLQAFWSVGMSQERFARIVSAFELVNVHPEIPSPYNWVVDTFEASEDNNFVRPEQTTSSENNNFVRPKLSDVLAPVMR